MARRMSRKERKAAFVTAAGKAYEELETWYDDHPEATYGEIEIEARQQRRKLMGRGMEILVNGRDTGQRAEGVRCTRCREEMEFKGYLAWTVRGLEGDAVLERAYYVCPSCEGETIFPPGPEVESAGGSLE